MPEIKPAPGQVSVQLPVLRSVVSQSRVLLQVVGSMTVPIGDTQGLYVGPDGYTDNIDAAQDFAPTVTEEQVIVESPGAPGKSAYQLWLESGHEGTYADYEAYNRGRPGVSATPEQIAAAVSAYITANPPAAGQNATDAQVLQALTAYIAAHPLADGKSVELRKTATAVQWRQTGGAWTDLVPLTAITGPAGPSPKVSLGTVTVTQTAALALSAGVRSVTLTVQGVRKDDDILLFPAAELPSGYAIHNVVATAANTLVVTFMAPLLALGATFKIDCRVVALR